MPSLPTSAFKPIKSLLAAKLDVTTPITSFHLFSIYFDFISNITVRSRIITHSFLYKVPITVSLFKSLILYVCGYVFNTEPTNNYFF